jgi:O-antigen/teichoic acid export membrane protein
MFNLGSLLRAQLLLQSLRMAQQFSVVFMFVRLWGSAFYADWVMLSSAAMFFGIVDLGIQTALSNACLSLSRDEDIQRLSATIRESMAFYIVFTAAIALFSMTAARLFNFGYFLRTGVMSQTVRDVVFLLLSSSALLNIPLTVLGSVYAARGQIARGIDRVSVQVVFQTVMLTVSLFVFKSAIAAAGAYALSSALGLAWVLRDLKRRYPELSFRPDFANMWRSLAYVRTGIYYAVNPFGGLLIQYILLFFLAGLRNGSGLIAVYAATRILVGAARQLSSQIANAAAAEIFRHWVRRDKSRSKELYDVAARFIATISGVLCGFIAPTTAPFLALWTHDRVIAEPMFTATLSGSIAVLAPCLLPISLIQISNKPQILTLGTAIQAFISLVSAAACSYYFDGMILVILISAIELMMTLALAIASRSYFGFATINSLAFGYMLCGLSSLISFLITYMLTSVIAPKSIIGIVELCGLAGLPLLLVLGLFGLRHATWAELLTPLRRHLNRRAA